MSSKMITIYRVTIVDKDKKEVVLETFINSTDSQSAVALCAVKYAKDLEGKNIYPIVGTVCSIQED